MIFSPYASEIDFHNREIELKIWFQLICMQICFCHIFLHTL